MADEPERPTRRKGPTLEGGDVLVPRRDLEAADRVASIHLAEALQRIGTKAYQATEPSGDGNGTDGEAPGGGEAAGEAASEDEGETVEGEYKEV